MAVIIPKGFFPVEDTGLLVINTEGPRGASFEAMAQMQGRLSEILRESPHVTNVVSNIGAGGPSISINQGRAFVELKERDGAAADPAGHPEPAARRQPHPGPAGLHQPHPEPQFRQPHHPDALPLHAAGAAAGRVVRLGAAAGEEAARTAAVAGRQHRPADRCAGRPGQRGPRPGHLARRLGRQCPAGAVLRLRQPADLDPLWPGQCLPGDPGGAAGGPAGRDRASPSSISARSPASWCRSRRWRGSSAPPAR